MCGVLSDSSLFYRCQVIALINSCQNKFGLFDQFTWQKKSEGSAQSEEVYFSLLHLARDLSQAEKTTTYVLLLQVEQIHKITTLSTQNDDFEHFEWKELSF